MSGPQGRGLSEARGCDTCGSAAEDRSALTRPAATATRKAKLRTPPGFRAEVTPRRLTVAPGAAASYKVTFERTGAAYGT